MSDPAKTLIAHIKKLDGHNWQTWQRSIMAALMYHDAWGIAVGTETAPTPVNVAAVAAVAATATTAAVAAVPAHVENQAAIDDFNKRNRLGFSTLVLSCTEDIQQRLDPTGTLRDNWILLERAYGTVTGLNNWVDVLKIFRFDFDTSRPLSDQIDELFTIRGRLTGASIQIPDNLFALALLMQLPDSYEVLKATTLSTSTISTLTPADVRQRILSEELRQNSSTMSVNAIRTSGKGTQSATGVDKCNYCTGGGHWEKDCGFKQRGVAREEARKRIERNRIMRKKDKEKDKADGNASATTTSTPSANATSSSIDTSSTSSSVPTTAATITTNTTPFLFYIARSTTWMFDSGCTHHITDTLSDFTTYTPSSSYVTLADKNETKVQFLGRGTIHATATVDGQKKPIILQDVLHSPGLNGRFLSLTSLTEKGISFQAKGTSATLNAPDGQVAAVGYQHNRHWWFPLAIAAPSVHTSSAPIPIELLHHRLGHLSWSALKHFGHELDQKSHRSLSTCEGCLLGKSTRRSYTSSPHRAAAPFELIHMDLCGPMKTRSLEGHDYFMILVDDHTRFLWVFFLLKKGEALTHYRRFSNFIHTNFERKIKGIRSDRGGEFTSKEFTEFLLSQGTTHQLTAPDTPMQNGMAERANRTVVNTARAMLHTAGLSYGFWERAIDTAVFVRNRAPTQSINFKTPYELLTGRHPDTSFLRTFGCLAYHTIPPVNRHKLAPSAEKLTFAGYDAHTKGYKLWDNQKHRFIVSPDATFEESIFPHRIQPTETSEQPDSPHDDNYFTFLPVPDSDDEELPDPKPNPVAPSNVQNPQHQPQNQQPVRRSTRITQGQHRGRPDNASQDATRVQRSIQRRPWVANISTYLMAASVTPNGDPTSYRAATQSSEAPLWINAMKEEINSQLENHTWELVELPPDRQTVKCRWVFLTKRNADGNPARHKARLVAKGYTQQQGIDYEETFAPVARLDSLRLLLALAAHEDWEIHQIDIKTAFLNGDLDEEIYMDQPEGFTEEGKEHLVCRLKKAIYGLKQASRQWYQHLRQTLLNNHFQELLTADVSIFFMRNDGGDSTVILIYVDDMAIFGSTPQLVENFKRLIGSHYKFTDLGEIRQFLGLNITRNRNNKTLSIDQQHYIRTIAERFDMTDAHDTHTPMAQGLNLTAAKDEQDPQLRTRYQSIIGSLMYAMLGSRPDICFTITRLSQFGSNPTDEHLRIAQRTMRYLNTTAQYQLVYGNPDCSDLIGYSDSDWAANSDDRRSTTGYVYTLNGGAVAWATRKQRTVALSSTEAEYMALTETSKHALWVKSLCEQLSFDIDLPISIHCDSKGAREITLNPVFHKRTKHIDIQHHFVRQQAEEGSIAILPIPTADNLADVFTKPLSRDSHSRLTGTLGLTNPT
jgi:transposase InsO family protein